MKNIISLFLLLVLFGCSDDENELVSSEGCVWVDEVIKVFDKKDGTPCSYTDVYVLDGDFYTICHCCVCRKIEQVRSCDGRNICMDVEGCTSNFLDRAEYQYSFE